mgnify:CR=1 FL=1
MWILPKNYPLSSAFVQDMVASKEDLTLSGLNIESSLMWRSKPTPLRTWLTRWKQDSYLQRLFTRILKPSQHTSFETKLASSLAVIPANPLAQQDSEKEPMTQDTYGLTLGDTSKQLDLFSASLKTSKDTSRLDSPQSLATWSKMVIAQRGEYSQRVKLALLTREKESTSWRTPSASDAEGGHMSPQGGKWKLSDQVHYTYTNGLIDPISFNKIGKSRQDINPYFLEKLMGVQTGWTELGLWEME